jgi:hypothetical protein
MTDQEINRAVAESVGDDRWLIVKRGYFYRPNGHGYTSHVSEAWVLPLVDAKKHEYLIGEEPVTLRKAPIPDYCNSYDAIIPLVKALDGTLKMKFIRTLGLDVLKICPLAGDVWMAQEYDCHAMLTATPRQLCEAYLAVGGADA